MSDNFSIGNNQGVGDSPNKKIKFGDSNSSVEFDPTNIFTMCNSIEEPNTEFLQRFDENKDGELNNNEPLAAEIALRLAIGMDDVLDDEELLQFLGEESYSLTAEKMRVSMLQYIEESREDVDIYDKNDGSATIYIHSDGSAMAIEEQDDMRIIEICDKDKNLKEHIEFKGKYQKDGEDDESYHVVEMVRFNDGFQIMTASACDDELKSDIKYSRTDYDYYVDGKMKESRDYTIHNSGEITNEVIKYRKNGKDKEYYKKESDNGVKKETTETFYAPQGFPVKHKITTIDSETIEEKIFEWNNISGQIESTDHILSDKSNPDIKIISNHKNYEEGLAKDSVTKTEQYISEAKYSGNKIEERDENMPNQIILKDSSGNVLKITTNDIDKNGILVGQTIDDKRTGVISKYDFLSPDGKYDVFYQGNSVGNCFKAQSINSFNLTEAGRRVLDNLVSKTETTDENGDVHTTYNITYPALPEVKKYMMDNFDIKEDELMFPADNTYHVTEEEIAKASSPENAGSIFTSGDKDALPLELAYIQFRFDSADTIAKAGFDGKFEPTEVSFITGFDGYKGSVSHGGQSAVTMYLMSGKKPDVYFSTAEDLPVCIRDVSSNTIKIAANSRVQMMNNLSDIESDCINETYSDIDDLIDILKQDTDENGLFKSTAAFVGLIISNEFTNDKAYRPGLHALTIKGIKDNTVILIDPTDPTNDFKMDLDEFREASMQAGGLYLGNDETLE